METRDALSGDWFGFYVYGAESIRHFMEINLRFVGEEVSGHGIDDVGVFSISGNQKGESVEWIKSYGSHVVEYKGNVVDGRVLGGWRIGVFTGGFLIWPRGKNGPGEEVTFPEPAPREEFKGRFDLKGM